MKRHCCASGKKSGQVEHEDPSGEFIGQLGTVIEQLNRHWYDKQRAIGWAPH